MEMRKGMDTRFILGVLSKGKSKNIDDARVGKLAKLFHSNFVLFACWTFLNSY